MSGFDGPAVQERFEWGCAYCGKAFRSPGSALLHSGSGPNSIPKCMIREEEQRAVPLCMEERLWLIDAFRYKPSGPWVMLLDPDQVRLEDEVPDHILDEFDARGFLLRTGGGPPSMLLSRLGRAARTELLRERARQKRMDH